MRSQDWFAVFQVQGNPGVARLVGACQAPCQARDGVVGDLADRYPFPSVEFPVPEDDPPLVVTEFAAAEDVEDLVAFAVVGCPVDGQELLGLAVDAEFFAQLSLAGCGGGLAGIDVTAGDVPVIAVGLALQQHPAVVGEQCPGGDPGGGKLGCRVGHGSTVGAG